MTTIKTHIGKEDFKIQKNTDTAEDFNRKTTTGGLIVITKTPDMWDGTGRLNIGELTVRAKD